MGKSQLQPLASPFRSSRRNARFTLTSCAGVTFLISVLNASTASSWDDAGNGTCCSHSATPRSTCPGPAAHSVTRILSYVTRILSPLRITLIGRNAFGPCFGRAVAWTAVTPQVSKKALAAPAAKDGARARASQLLPAHAQLWPLKKHDGRAESAMIAVFGLRELGALAQQREAAE